MGNRNLIKDAGAIPSYLPPFSARGLLKRLAQVPPGQLVIAFYVNVIYGGQYEWMNELAKKCAERGMLTVAIHTPRSFGKSSIPSANIQAVVDPAHIRCFDRIDAFVISDMDSITDYPARSRVLACQHTFGYSSSDSAFETSAHFLASVDGFLMPRIFTRGDREQIRALWSNLFDPARIRRPPRPFQLISCGYPRLAIMSKEIDASGDAPEAILYAPGIIRHAIEKGGRRIRAHGLKIIDFLLKRFPDRKVIFRPFYGDRDAPEVKEIIDFFREEPRFEVDQQMEQAQSFAKSAVVVSDYSNVGRSFSVFTGRPSIYFRPWADSDTPHEADPFLYCYTYEQLGDTVSQIFAAPEFEKERVTRRLARTVPEFAGALDNLADLLPDFIAGNKRPEWIELERANAPITVAGIIARCAAIDNPARVNIAAAALMYTYPDSPLLAAYSLHMGKIWYRDTNLIFGIRAQIARILGHDIEAPTFGDVSNRDIEELYIMAAREPENNMLARELLARFKRDFGENK